MTLRHAAAFVLVGWFLMTAPVANQGSIIYQDASLSEWKKAEHFDSEPECEARRREVIADSQDAAALVPKSEVDEDARQDAANAVNQALVSRCVADNDPAIGNTAPELRPGALKRLLH
jgi:hypothetical protein